MTGKQRLIYVNPAVWVMGEQTALMAGFFGGKGIKDSTTGNRSGFISACLAASSEQARQIGKVLGNKPFTPQYSLTDEAVLNGMLARIFSGEDEFFIVTPTARLIMTVNYTLHSGFMVALEVEEQGEIVKSDLYTGFTLFGLPDAVAGMGFTFAEAA